MLSVYKRAIARASRATISICLCATLIGCGGSSVSTPAPTAQFTTPTQATTASLGDSVSLAWTSTAATGCVASESNAAAGNFVDTQPVNGVITVTPTATGDFTYTISCTGNGGTAYATATVTVAMPKPTVAMAVPAQDTSIQLGRTSPITWLSTNATSCTSEATGGFFSGFFDITFGGPPSNATSGTVSVTPSGTGNFTYTVTCSGPGGTASANTSITVAAVAGAAPITITAPAPGTSVVLGQPITVTWQAPAAAFCAVIDGPGAEIGNGSTSGPVSITTAATGSVIYGVTCIDANGRQSFAAAPAVTVTPDFVGLAKISTVGPTVDPILRDLHPSGLTLATETAGLITAGDLLTCNFDDSGNNVGRGTTIVGLHPSADGTPYSIAQSAQLTGCNQLLTLPDGTLFAAAYTANQTPMITPAGVVSAALPVGSFIQPSGIAYAPGNTLYVTAIDVSRPDGGSIYRVTLNGDTPSAASVVRIVSGLCTSGSPGALFGPVALMYVQSGDVLYIADTSSAELIDIFAVSTFSDAGQFQAVCNGPPPTYLGKNEDTPQEDNIGFITFGPDFPVTPIGMTQLANGNFLVVNGDLLAPGAHSPPANSIIELSSQLSVLGPPRQLDNGPPGALSGIVATTDSQGNQIVYFTDANTNSVMMLKE